ncbi:hypothetical protein NDU88_007585 [Pleurodeles waltl]|uniref:Uncharacterized protein n=1 Tax=Pleurodeles waltl TaxID=8319 RepID=A0AAV7VSW5_PLEWA|nr:hypothetical protein NDU88_007585 [Pleurodeles waltl]
MLGLSNSSIKQLQEKTRTESCRAQIGMKLLRGAVRNRKVNKMCSDIGEQISTMEDRAAAVEGELGALKGQIEAYKSQLMGVMWMLEDFENRQLRNNLRFLGIVEGVEVNDIRAYMLSLLKGALPELSFWNWDLEVQQVYRFPLMLRGLEDTSNPRPIFLYFGNFLLRQAFFEKSQPHPKCTFYNQTFFTRLDFLPGYC